MQSKSHIDAVAKYNKGKYTNFQAQIKIEEATTIDNYCKSIGLSKAATIVNAVKYLIENNVNLAEWIKKGKQTEAENKQIESGEAENN